MEIVHLAVVEKFNPYHDEKGRFASADRYVSFTYAPGKSKAHDLAIAREKERSAGKRDAISDELYNQWRAAAQNAQKAQGMAYKNPRKNWSKMSDVLREFEKVDRKVATIAAENYGKQSGFKYDEIRNKSYAYLPGGGSVAVWGVNSGANPGQVCVERYGKTKAYEVHANYEDAYAFANKLVKEAT